jgi:type I restriction enzyme S subunit
LSEFDESEIPSSWLVVNLGEVASFEMGQAPAGSASNFDGVGTIFVKAGEFGVTMPIVREWTTEPKKFAKAGDVLICVVGATAGKLNLGINCAIGRSVAAIRPTEALAQKAIYYQLLPNVEKMRANSTGSAQGVISQSDLAKLTVCVPPRAEQTRIVEKLEELLSDLDAGVAELKAAQRKLAQYRQSLLKAAVEGALTADWRAAHGKPQETGAELLQRILRERRARWEQKQLAKFAEQGKTPPTSWQDKYPEPVAPDLTDLPPLPEGWVWASVDQLAFVVRGASPRPAGDPRFFGGEIPWITVGSLTADETMYLESVDQFVTNAGKDASRYVEPDTLLLTNSGATLGVPKITKIGGCINDGSVALLDVEGAIKIFLYWFLRTQTKKLRALNQGAAQPNLNTDIVRNIAVPLASMSEIEEINRILDFAIGSVFLQEHNLDHRISQSTAQRKNILKAAFSGQLVPQDPNDEPASALLARIRAQREANADAPARKRGRKAKGAA